MQYTYGITTEQYSQIFADQNGLCAICKQMYGKSLCVDHCHITGKVRGLLCLSCNAGVGQFKEDKNFLLEAIKYLNKHK